MLNRCSVYVTPKELKSPKLLVNLVNEQMQQYNFDSNSKLSFAYK